MTQSSLALDGQIEEEEEEVQEEEEKQEEEEEQEEEKEEEQEEWRSSNSKGQVVSLALILYSCLKLYNTESIHKGS